MSDSGQKPEIIMDVAESTMNKLKNNSVLEARGENGGARRGAGRPRGSMNARSIERMQAKRHIIGRIISNADKIFNAQLDKAIGEKFLMVKITERGSRGGVIREYHEIVDDPQTIIEYLDGELEGGTSIGDADHYYYMTTKPADNLAAANLLDRAFGKPTEKVELGTPGETDLSELSDEELARKVNEKINVYLKSRANK